MAPDLLQKLKDVPEFKTVQVQHLEWLAEKGEVVELKDGDKLFKRGDSVDHLRIILEGEVKLFFEQNGNLRDMGSFEKGEITGLLPYSRMKNTMAEGIVIGQAAIFQLHKDRFPEMIRDHHELTAVFVHNMTDRVRDFTKQQQQDDKMMSLGKLSAGLAHELNNPSAAVVRSARELKRHLANMPEKFKSVIKIHTTDDVVDAVNDLVFSKISSASGMKFSLMEKTEKEDAITEWLESNDVENAYELAETFAEFNLIPEDLNGLKSILRPEDKAAVINWLNQVLTTERLVVEIEEASKRINDLVLSIKSYTHMDQAQEKNKVDIHLGIRNTLTMLNHKLKKGNVKLIESFSNDLPQPNIFVSEMNQVWTNLIDNALDAMEGRDNCILEIKTQRDREFINVFIIDNGPGIPKEILEKIFDPFFTTKPIGKGTGLGLEVVKQIVNQHNGKVDVRSEPGRTEFKVCVPIN